MVILFGNKSHEMWHGGTVDCGFPKLRLDSQGPGSRSLSSGFMICGKHKDAELALCLPTQRRQRTKHAQSSLVLLFSPASLDVIKLTNRACL